MITTLCIRIRRIYTAGTALVLLNMKACYLRWLDISFWNEDILQIYAQPVAVIIYNRVRRRGFVLHKVKW